MDTEAVPVSTLCWREKRAREAELFTDRSVRSEGINVLGAAKVFSGKSCPRQLFGATSANSLSVCACVNAML